MAAVPVLDEKTYRRRIFAWTMYDWANSAFVTTILAAVLPIYYSQVAGSTLPSDAIATSYWSLGLSLSLLIVAILSPILGTVSDIVRGKKRFLAVFAGIGIVGTAALVLVGTGDWMLASVAAVIGRIGFNGSITFYDALLPHVARSEDQDRVSALGYAMGYLGGGLLLAINVVMIFVLGFEDGARLSFLSVAVWWAVFTIPLLRNVPEPPSATAKLEAGESVIMVSFKRLWETLKDIRRYRELAKYLVAFLIYNDAIGTIIGLAAIYGTELGFGSIELILALLLVQFVGIPFSLMFGRLPNASSAIRPVFLAFIVFNLVALPVVGIVGGNALPQNITGILLPPYESVDGAAGTGVHTVDSESFARSGVWEDASISAEELGTGEAVIYARTSGEDAQISFKFNGESVTLVYAASPDYGVWQVLLDGAPLTKTDSDGVAQPVTLDAYNSTLRYGNTQTFDAPEPGVHTLTLASTGEKNASSGGFGLALSRAEVARPVSQSNLMVIIGAVLAVQAVGVVFAYTIGRRLFAAWAFLLTTRSSIFLALIIYSVIATWGFFINSTIEFWFLAWMVAIVQGGSQALSRSLFAYMSPASKSGEFFGLFAIMEKFSSFIGPLIFAIVAASLGSSRPAILALIAFFIIGGGLLMRVNVAEGRRVAVEEDAAALAKF